MDEASPTDRDTALKTARQHLEAGRHDAALAAIAPLLAQDGEDRDSLYIEAVAHRLAGRIDQATQAADALLSAHPDYGRGFQERAQLHMASGEREAAAAAFRSAVTLNPALHASWQALSTLEAELGRSEAAQMAREQHAYIAGLPPEIASAASMVHEGRLYRAEQLCRHYLRREPRHVEAMRLLADIGARTGVLDDAEFILDSALAFAPDHEMARFDYVGVLLKRQKYARALEEAEKLCAGHPGLAAFESVRAQALSAVGRYEDALAIYDRLLGEAHDPAGLHLQRGHALKTIGRQDEAVAAYRAAHEIRGDFGDAWWSLANLKTYHFSEAELSEMERREASGRIARPDRYHLCFALGKAHEDRGDFGRAFSYYERGNQLKKDELRYTSEAMQREFDRQKAACTPQLFDSRRGSGCPAPDPIFILGLPRAGSTLLEQILASHSQVDGTMELPHILALAHRLSGRRRIDEAPLYPANLPEIPSDKLAAFGQRYLDDTAANRAGAPFFTDKMPNNFRHIGLIHLILPNAKIIDARRDPMACCFSGFKQLFAEGQEFTYGLEEIGHYYRGYVDLMDHWDTVLPGKILRVQHEDVVADLEGQVRRILDHCGLPFEQACLDFHKTERAVRTASSEQVRQPISDKGLEAWKPFEPWLQPLKEALGPELAPG